MKTYQKIIVICFLFIVGFISTGLLLYNFASYIIEKDFYLLGSEEIVLEYGQKYSEPGINVHSKEIRPYIEYSTNLDEESIGSYTINYILNYTPLKKRKTLTRKINIVDSEAPKLNVEGEKTIYLDLGEEYKMPNYSAHDNYDGDITNTVTVTSNVDNTKEGKYKTIFLSKDSSGNKTVHSVDVIVEEKFKNTYIEISISNQKLNYYQKNKLVLSTDVVTGYNNWTPTGNFSVLNKAQNIYLVGANYRSFVRYWIAFKGINYGMHDASWRYAFGGQIYKTNGSHGCVNMPTESAKKLYEMVEIGTPVYIKK